MAIKNLNAAEILRACGGAAGPGEWWDFHRLPSSSVREVIAAADAAGYRAPKNANGSRARYFYAALVRQARAEYAHRARVRRAERAIDAAGWPTR